MEQLPLLNRPYASLCSESRTLLFTYSNNQETETLEKLCITINKLRAIYKILKYSGNPEIDIRPKKFLLNIYQRSSEIKDIHQRLQVILALPIQNKKTITWYKRTLETLIYLFRKNIENYIEQLTEQEKAHNRFFSNIKNEDIIAYVNSINVRIKQNLTIPCIDESIHKGRRILKEILYNALLFEKEQIKLISIDLSIADNLQELIGQWHDKSIFLEDLENEEECRLMGITDASYKNQLITSTSSLKITLRKEIDKRIPTLVPIKKSENLGKLKVLQYLEPEH